MSVYTADHINPMSWAEYAAAVERLADRVSQRGILFDAVAPILRSGGIPGNVLAIRLQITRIIPLQFKYLLDPAKPEPMNPLPCHPSADPLTILICENNTSTGRTARAAIACLRSLFPKARLHYATVAKVFGGPDSFEEVQGYYFGIQTNERFLASTAQMEDLSLRPGITLFPWELSEHELAEINSCQSGTSNQARAVDVPIAPRRHAEDRGRRPTDQRR
jgi:hypoxanthine phosphoribosyltransferase